MKQAIAQQAVDKFSQVSYSASGTGIVAGLWTWLGENPQAVGAACAVVGVLVAVGTFFVNWWYKSARFNRDLDP